jgi:hypothetical protein
MTASSSDAIAVLRIEIEYIEPLIWRRVAVRISMNLKGLHKVIQAAMGWLDYHLREFKVVPLLFAPAEDTTNVVACADLLSVKTGRTNSCT